MVSVWFANVPRLITFKMSEPEVDLSNTNLQNVNSEQLMSDAKI